MSLPGSAYGVAAPPVETDHFPQCWRCARTLAEYLTRPWSLRCRKCHAENRAGAPPVVVSASTN